MSARVLEALAVAPSRTANDALTRRTASVHFHRVLRLTNGIRLRGSPSILRAPSPWPVNQIGARPPNAQWSAYGSPVLASGNSILACRSEERRVGKECR